MSLLNYASYQIKERGYDYYIDEKVVDSNQINVSEFEGIVQGNQDYHVKINIHQPHLSTCDCPYAIDHTICKHMVALYFYNFPNEVDEYLCEEDEEDEWDNKYYNKWDEVDEYIPKTFEKPIYYEEMLTQYINSLNKEELKEIAFKELNKDDYYTYNNYLKSYEESYKKSNKSEIYFINELKYKLKHKLDIYNYEYHDYSEPLLTSIEKSKIINIYNNYSKQLDEILLNPELSIYEDYQWVIIFYKEKLSYAQLFSYKQKLIILFENYKHRGIRNTECKSNILISIDLLIDMNEFELINSLLSNSKYSEYIDYIFEYKALNKDMFMKLKDIVNKNLGKYKHNSVETFKKFERLYPNDLDIKKESIYIQFMSKGDPIVLSQIKDKNIHDELIKRILINIKQDYNLIKLYIYLERFDELYEMLMNKKDDYSLMNYVHYFKEKYSDELEVYFIDKFLSKLNTGMKREIYKDASKYIRAIYKLSDGRNRVFKFIDQLKDSEFKNRRALFDEMYNAIK